MPYWVCAVAVKVQPLDRQQPPATLTAFPKCQLSAWTGSAMACCPRSWGGPAARKPMMLPVQVTTHPGHTFTTWDGAQSELPAASSWRQALQHFDGHPVSKASRSPLVLQQGICRVHHSLICCYPTDAGVCSHAAHTRLLPGQLPSARHCGHDVAHCACCMLSTRG